jgi:hypothetical protein
MMHSPVFLNVYCTVEQVGGVIVIDPKPYPLRAQFGDVITWTFLNRLESPIEVALDGLEKAIASFKSAQKSETPPVDPGDSAALSGSITAKPKKSVNYTYTIVVTIGGASYDVDPDLQVDPPPDPSGGKRRRKAAGGGKKKARKGAKKK